AINGTNGISLNGSGAGISFSGNNNHIVQATQGSLTINNAQLNNPTFSSNVIFNNKVGIGNASPQFRLDVQDSQDSSPVALIKNTSTSPNASVLSLQIGA